MTGGAGCNRARLQPKSFDTEGRPPAANPNRYATNARPAHVIFRALRRADGETGE
jgi:hypothetical protein